LTTFRRAAADPQQLVEYLAVQGIIVRTIKELNSVRASVGFFNTEDEIDSLARAVAGFQT
jgi:selenocysteine lyase/cysteine desulfurase